MAQRRCSAQSVILLVALCCLFAFFCEATSNPALDALRQDLRGPITAQPLIKTSILADTNHVLSQSPQQAVSVQSMQALSNNFQQLFTLSANEVSMTSLSAPQELDEQSFFPFGRHMSLSFQLPQSQHAEQMVLAEESYDFVLDVDETVTSTDPSNPSVSLLNSAPQYYHRHTNYKGKRVNAQGEEETILVTIVPLTTTAAARRASSPTLETQSTPSGGKPQIEGYSIHAYLLSNSKVYQITTYQQLLEQLQLEQQAVVAEKEQRGGDASEQSIQTTMDILSNNMITLSEQRSLAENDLLIRELPLPSQQVLGSTCGVVDKNGNAAVHPIGEHNDAEGDANPLEMQPQWQLTEWPSTCHRRMHTYTIFTIKFWFTTPFRRWGSGLDETTGPEDQIVNEKAEAIAKGFQQINNHITSAQFRVALKIIAFVHGTDEDTREWNNWKVCKYATQISDLGNYRKEEPRASVDHILTRCGSEYAGLAYVGIFCGGGGGGGITGSFSMNSWPTLLHEVGHQMNAAHSTIGGVMGAGGGVIRAPPDDVNDGGKQGFSYASHKNDVCPHMDLLMTTGRDLGDRCWQAPTAAHDKMCENDGMLKPWQECQGTSKCCSNCKFASGATCTAEHPQCCPNCRAPTGPTFCTVGEDTKGGYCTPQGTCKKHVCETAATEGRSISEVFVAPTNKDVKFQDACAIFCWRNFQGQIVPTLNANRRLEKGDVCLTLAGEEGVCVTSTTTGTGLKCAPRATAEAQTFMEEQKKDYQWEYYVFAPGVCDPKVELQDTYVCRGVIGERLGSNGDAVPESFCEGKEKPPRAIFDCSSKITDIVAPKFIDRLETVTISWKYTQGATAPANQTVTLTAMIGQQHTQVLCKDVLMAAEQCTFTLSKDVPYHTSINIVFEGQHGLKIVHKESFAVTQYVWDTSSAWGACSAKTCGAGVRVRPVWCRRQATAVNEITPVDEVHCHRQGTTKPVAAENCNGGTCGNGGACFGDVCQCATGWTGNRCQTDVCKSGCQAAWTETCAVGQHDACPCKSGYFGATCAGNEECSFAQDAVTGKDVPKCLHGGWIQQKTTAEAVCLPDTVCRCSGNWSNSLTAPPNATHPGCDKCKFPCTGGAPNADCTACQCAKNTWGSDCQCAELEFTLQFLQFDDIMKSWKNQADFQKFIADRKDQEKIVKAQQYLAKLQSVYLRILQINALRLEFVNWRVNDGALFVTAKVKALCATDESVAGYKAIADVASTKYTPREELYYFVDLLIKGFNTPAPTTNVPILYTPEAKTPLLDDEKLTTAVIDNNQCDDKDMTSGEYQCELPKKTSSRNNNAATFTISLASVVAVLFAVATIIF